QLDGDLVEIAENPAKATRYAHLFQVLGAGIERRLLIDEQKKWIDDFQSGIESRDSQIRDFHRAAGAREDIIGQLHAEIGRQSSALQKSNRTVQSLMERITRFHEQIAHQVAMIEAL